MLNSNHREVLDFAKNYHAMGWRILPLQANTKRPVIRWSGLRNRPLSDAEIQKWFGQNQSGVGVIFGEPSRGLISRDFDDADSYTAWADSNPELAKTLPTVRTARGYHVYAGAAETAIDEVRRLFGASGCGAIKVDQGELRIGPGCYSALPPTTHPSGKVYQWLGGHSPSEIPEIDLFESGWLVRPDRKMFCNLPASLRMDLIATLPTAAGQRNRKVFDLARVLKGHQQFRSQTTKQLIPILKEWHDAALPAITTKDFLETLADFANAWARVKFGKGDHGLSLAVEAAKTLPPPKEVECITTNHAALQLGALCRELQKITGDKPFFLACRTVEEQLRIPAKTANRWLNSFRAIGILELVAKGDRKNANEYRYLGAIND